MSIHLSLRNHILRITHEERSSFEPPPGALLMTPEDQHFNTVTRIDVEGDELNPLKRTVYVAWSFYQEIQEATPFGVHLVEETRTLFVGGRELSAVIDLQELRFVQQKTVCLFWDFRRIYDYVVELGELDCFLYSLKGELLDKAAVDPPYDYHILADGIRFMNPSFTAWLRFPKPA